MKFSVNMVIQVCALLTQALNAAGELGLGPKANMWVAIGLTLTQAVTGVLAHFSTPPNTPTQLNLPR